MRIGIVGLPNAGKSSLFNALTRAGAEAASYPFTTVEPNVAVVGVPDERLHRVAEAVAAAPVDGLAIGGTLGRDKAEMYGVLGLTVPLLPVDAPKHLLGIGEPDDLMEGIARGIDFFDCAVPTRLARHGMALANRPGSRHRFDVARAAYERDQGPLVDGCPCAACRDHSRAYLHYLVRARELTAVRLLSLHNLTYLERLVAGAREAIADAAFGSYRQAIVDGATPWDASTACSAG